MSFPNPHPHPTYHDTSDTESLLAAEHKTFSSGRSSSDIHSSLRPRSKTTRLLAQIRAHWYILDICGFAIIIFLLVGLYDKRESLREEQIGGDVSGWAPRFEQEIVKFRPEERYVPKNPVDWFNDEAVREAWLDLVPTGLGYLSLPPTTLPTLSQSLLPHPLTNPQYTNRTVYTTSVTHQLHCLHSILDSFYKTALPNPPLSSPATSGHSHHSAHSEDSPAGMMDWHLLHCFDYLRQAITCAGDTALEGAQTTFPPGFDGSDGWDARHVCKRWGDVRGWMETNRADDKRWI